MLSSPILHREIAMQEKARKTINERLIQLIEGLAPEQQAALAVFLETTKCACNCDLEERLAKAPPGSTLSEAGIDAQDWVNHLRGHRCG